MRQFRLSLTYGEAWIVASALSQATAQRPIGEARILEKLRQSLLDQLREHETAIAKAEGMA